ncbi:ABC transporter substrate-binding protein [Paenibacillus koleovorans]|uniref:ABC transporter substrate-binding protein n=1 Tax=Paenibacillus koleovorans TaxID=121608 RepID=UPI000FDBE84E|nr:ABC transporter substrate-binding protein [Paenibacillus koleovorans]
MSGIKGKKLRTALLLGLVVTLGGTAVACSGTKGNEAAGEQTGSPAPSAAKLDISWAGANARGKVEDNNYVQQKLESKFNIKLTNKKVDLNNPQQVSLMLASGELPEATFFSGNDALKLFTDGETRTIPKAMILKYAPNYAKMLDDNPPGWKMGLAPNKTDEYVSLAGISGSVEGQLWGNVYRLDWLEKLGFKPKGNPQPVGTSGGRERVFFTKEAFTLEEEAKIFDAMVNQDPDGNGKKDTYAFTPYNDTLLWWGANYLGAYGLGADLNLEENGKVTNFNISPRYKDFLNKMAEWYKLGYIDPEFVTLNRVKGWEKFSTGKIGSAQSQYNAAALMTGVFMQRPPGNLVAKDPNVKILITPPQIGPNGKQGAPAYRPVSLLGGYDFVIRKDVSDEKLSRILQVFDYINFDKEGLIMSSFGEVGTHFNWEGEPYKSAALPINNSNADDKFGLRYYNHAITTREMMTYTTPQDVMKLVNDYFFNKNEGMKLMIQPYKFDLFKQTKYNELLAKNGEKLNTIANEYLFKAIVGEVKVDDTWNAYVDNWRKNGGDELLAELEKSPKSIDLMSSK